MHHGPFATGDRRAALQGREPSGATCPPPRAPWDWFCTAGPGDLFPTHGGGETEDGPSCPLRQEEGRTGAGLRHVSGGQENATSTWRGPVGGAAAAAGHRARTGHRTDDADPGRTN